MSSGKNPLMLMMALSMPGAANAIGLGDIHVDSGLNERLAAEIDIVGATALELADLQAAVANRETFLRYGMDRPAFLSSATFKVTQDSRGRPVLAVRSTESFTEPLVNFLVDLRWNHGELVRQYTLLLDPPGFAAANQPAEAGLVVADGPLVSRPVASTPAASTPVAPAPVAAAPIASTPAAATPVASTPVAPALAAAAPAASAPVAASPAATAAAQTVASRMDAPSALPGTAGSAGIARKTTHIKVGAKATLRGIAWRAGERSEADLQRMMIGIFRANPNAFGGNINRLHRGAVLTIPSRAQLSAISAAEAKREVQAQMAAWHSPASHAVAAHVAAEHSAAAQATAAQATAARDATAGDARAAVPEGSGDSSSAASSGEALDRRVQSLEQELDHLKGVLQSEQDELLGLQQKARAVNPAASDAESRQTIGALQTANGARRTADGAPETAKTQQSVEAAREQSGAGHTSLPAMLAGLGALGAALAALYFKFRRRTPAPQDAHGDGAMPVAEGPVDTVDADASTEAASVTAASIEAGSAEEAPIDAVPAADLAAARAPIVDEAADALLGGEQAGDDEAHMQAIAAAHMNDATHPMLPIIPAEAAGRSEVAAKLASRAAAHEPTVNLRVDTVNMRMESTRLDYNLLDLDLTAQHVQMPSVLNEHVVVKERRTNLADVLKLAIEREPDRHDLRMKLLELYYAAATTNRQAFLEVVQKFARDRNHLQAEQWDKIAFMGRQIACESPLFAEESAADDDLADCA